MVWLEIIVVLGAIFFGIRQGGIGIGLCGGLGLAILTLGFGLPMGSPPVDVILIIMTVVVAASALQAAGGMDYLVRVAGNFMRRNPKYINIIAPIITWSMTIMAGTGFIVFSTLPVIAEVAKESGIRPSRTLAGCRFAGCDFRFADQRRNGGYAHYYGGKRCQFYSSDVGMSSHLFCCRDGRRFYCFPTGM